MGPLDRHYISSEQDSHNPHGDQTDRESDVPPALTQLFERSESEQPVPQPLDVFQPADWPPCPDCEDRLIAAAVATDAHETLIAAAMICYNREHETKRYIYDVDTETVYFDQVLAVPDTETTDECDWE